MGRRDRMEQKILDVDASMQGTLMFKDPVNLRINGRFEGKLDTKGSLIIGEHAVVTADITGETIAVNGKVTGNVTAAKELKIMPHAHIVGDITTPLLSVESGAVIQGRCQMLNHPGHKANIFNAEQLAKYLEVDISNIMEWATAGRIPAFKEGGDWRFDRTVIDEWIARERAR